MKVNVSKKQIIACVLIVILAAVVGAVVIYKDEFNVTFLYVHRFKASC